MRASFVAVLSLLAVTACDGDDPDGGDATQKGPPPMRAKITGTDLHAAAPGMLMAPKRFTLFGRVTGGTRAQRKRSVVEVYASTYPRRSWRRVARRRGGEEVIGFRLRPRRNTRYELRIMHKPGSRSKRVRVYVDLPGRVDASLPAVGVVDASYRVHARYPLEPARGITHFYIRPEGRGPLRHIGSARARSDGRNAVIASAHIEDRRVASKIILFACVKGVFAKGQGRPEGSDAACGSPAIRATAERLGRE